MRHNTHHKESISNLLSKKHHGKVALLTSTPTGGTTNLRHYKTLPKKLKIIDREGSSVEK